jgi:hypothetical protein
MISFWVFPVWHDVVSVCYGIQKSSFSSVCMVNMFLDLSHGRFHAIHHPRRNNQNDKRRYCFLSAEAFFDHAQILGFFSNSPQPRLLF